MQDRNYRGALRLAMNARRLGSGQIIIDDPTTIAVIQDALESDSPGRVINALGLIDKIKGFDRALCYERLLTHSAEAVRYEVMRQVEVLGPGGFDPARVRTQTELETEPALRAAAVRTLATIDPANATNNLVPLLSADDDPVRREAFVGLLRHGGIEGILRSGDAAMHASVAPILRRALSDQLETDLKSLVHVLALFHPEADMADAWSSYRSEDAARRAITVEALETLLQTDIRAAVLALLEHDDDRKRLSALPAEYRPGALISGDVARGQAGNAMYVVVEGRIKAHIGEKVLAELGPNDVVGEMAALDPEPRSASVRAIEPTLLLRISNQNLQLLIDHNPDVARGIIKVLCTRLRHEDTKAAGA